MQEPIIHNGLDYTDILYDYILYKYGGRLDDDSMSYFDVIKAAGPYYLLIVYKNNKMGFNFYFKYSEINEYIITRRNNNINILLDATSNNT